MSLTLPAEIRVETGARVTRYRLPPRETGRFKSIAVFMIGFGFLFGGFALFWMLAALGMTQKEGVQLGGVLFALFGVPFALAGLGIIGLGTFTLCGRCEIEITAEELLARERGGPFWWTRRMLIKDIKRFALAGDVVRRDGRPVMAGPLSEVGALMADVGALSPRLILLGYPRVWTDALAARLNADLAALTGAAPIPTTVTKTDLLTGELVVSGDRFDPPAGTAIRIMEQAGGIVAVVPPSGFNGVSRFLLGFSALWLLISLGVGAGFVAAALSGEGNQPPWFVFLIIGGSILAGLGMLVGAVNLARRKASIRAARTELIILQQSLFGTKTFNFTGDDLGAICVGNSGMTINDSPIQEVQVHTKAGEKRGFFSNLTLDELCWLGTHLRHATGVGEKVGESAEPPKLG